MGTLIPVLVPLEERLINKRAEEGKKKPLIIAIGGFSGTGKDTLSLSLIERIRKEMGIKLNRYNAGDIIRDIAVKEGFAPRDLDKFVDKIKDDRDYSDKIDLKVEKQTLLIALEKGGVFTGRMAPFTIGGNGFTVFLRADYEIIAQRLSKDKNRDECGCPISKIAEKIRRRDKGDKKRLTRLYGIDFDKLLEKVDIILDSSHHSINESTERIYTAFKEYCSILR
ncbi:MAG: AAA family ATPase [Candidatus Hodarchaeales archaeon]